MRILIFLFVFTLAFGCKTRRQPAGDNCEVLGAVKDFSKLDGCGLLIELENGDLLNPVRVPEGLKLEAGQTIRFSYKVLEDMMSVCMREKAAVEITCLKIVGETQTAPGNCVDTTNPFSVPWMDKALDRHNPNQVIKYKFGGEWGYLFKAIPTSYLYDCEGRLLCETQGDQNDDCHVRYLNRFTKGKIIWQGEGIWD